MWAEIDIDALIHNYRVIRKTVGTAKVLAAVKAEAYGHGAREISRILENLGTDYFGVASVEEGIDLRVNGQIRRPILVLSPVPYREIEMLYDYDLTPSVTEQGFTKALAQEANRRGKVLGVHVEVDTGMGRTGVLPSQAPALISIIANKPGLRLDGIFTHFPAAESDEVFTREQIGKFDQLVDRLKQEGITVPALHCANSAALFKYPEGLYDIVRPGLSLYGIQPDGFEKKLDLHPVMSLRTRIVNLRMLPEGASISYGRTVILDKQTLVGTVSAGYGDGYPRALSNKGQVLYHGKRYPIIGTICMDLTMIDLTGANNPGIGDEVTLMGKDEKALLAAEEIAQWASTIPYEITTRISPRVTRIYKTTKRILGARTLLGSTSLT